MYNEHKLVQELRKGRHEAFRSLYEYYHDRIYSFLYNILRDEQNTKELFQTVFLKIWEHRATIDPERSFSGYIYKIARNTIYNHLEKELYNRRMTAHLMNRLSAFAQEDTESLLMANDLKQHLGRLIDKLPEQRKKIFILFYVRQKSYKEIAELLHISENTINTQLRRALGFLREHISREHSLLLLNTFFLF